MSKGTYYIGSTSNLQRRLKEHHSGKSKYTKTVLPVTLIGFIECESSSIAKWKEKELKKSAWKRKKFISELEGSSLSESIDS